MSFEKQTGKFTSLGPVSEPGYKIIFRVLQMQSLALPKTHLRGYYKKTSLVFFTQKRNLNINLANISDIKVIERSRISAFGILWLTLISSWLVAWFLAMVVFSDTFGTFIVSTLCFSICVIGTFQAIMRMTNIGTVKLGGWGFDHQINGHYVTLKRMIEFIIEPKDVLGNYEISFNQFRHLTYNSIYSNKTKNLNKLENQVSQANGITFSHE